MTTAQLLPPAELVEALCRDATSIQIQSALHAGENTEENIRAQTYFSGRLDGLYIALYHLHRWPERHNALNFDNPAAELVRAWRTERDLLSDDPAADRRAFEKYLVGRG